MCRLVLPRSRRSVRQGQWQPRSVRAPEPGAAAGLRGSTQACRSVPAVCVSCDFLLVWEIFVFRFCFIH